MNMSMGMVPVFILEMGKLLVILQITYKLVWLVLIFHCLYPVAYQSFGGWKRSLFGDLFMYGPDGVRFFTRRKTITQRWPTAQIREGAQFSMPTL